MSIEDPRNGASASRSVLAAALLTAATCALLVRVVTVVEPLGIDQSLWASAVRGMARGQLLYRDVWEQRPPGIYFTYLAGFTVFGWTPAAVAWLDVIAATLTTLLLWSTVRQLMGSTAGALVAAIYAVGTIPSWLFGHGGFLERSVSETFIIACVAAAAWCAVGLLREARPVFALGLGLASGAAVVLKPNAGLYLPALLGWMIVYRHTREPGAVRPLVRIAGLTAAGALVVPGVTLAWLWRLDLLAEASVAVIDFNRFYVGQGFSIPTYAGDFSRAVFLRLKTDPVWFSGGVGTLLALWQLARTRRLSPAAGLAMFWGAAAALVIIVNGARLFNTYFLQAYPPLAIMAAWALSVTASGSRARRSLAVAIAVLMLTIMARRDFAGRVLDWTMADVDALRGHVHRMDYLERFGGYANSRGYSARANTELADYIRAHTSVDERIFLFGINGAGVYFEADRLTAHRFLRVNFFVPAEFPDPRFSLPAVIADLETARPRYLIFERLNAVSPRGAEMARAVDALPDNPLLQPLLKDYSLETRIEDFALYRRVD